MSSQFTRLSAVLAKSLSLSIDQLTQSFRPALATEISLISNMRRQIFGRSIKDSDEEYLAWRYFRSTDSPSTLWVFEYQGAIIAVIGTEPVELVNCGKHEAAIRNMDAMVDPLFNNRGLGAWMSLMLQERHTCILVCGANNNSRSMLRKIFHGMPARQNRKLILASEGYFQKRVIPPIAGVMSLITNALLACRHHFKWEKISAPKNVEILTINSIEELCDLMPNGAGYLGDIKVHRSRNYLDWRYRDNPQADVMITGAFKQKKLLGYAVYHLNTETQFKVGRIVEWDIFSENDRTRILSSIYLQVIMRLKNAGAKEILITLNDKTSIDSAKNTGFILRESDSEIFVYYKGAKSDDPIYSPERWYQSISDADAEGV